MPRQPGPRHLASNGTEPSLHTPAFTRRTWWFSQLSTHVSTGTSKKVVGRRGPFPSGPGFSLRHALWETTALGVSPAFTLSLWATRSRTRPSQYHITPLASATPPSP